MFKVLKATAWRIPSENSICRGKQLALTRKVGEQNTPEAAKKIPSAFVLKVVTRECERGNCGIGICGVCSSVEIVAHTSELLQFRQSQTQEGCSCHDRYLSHNRTMRDCRNSTQGATVPCLVCRMHNMIGDPTDSSQQVHRL
jgi:hypothetical protein